jgi:exonuclease SbcC
MKILNLKFKNINSLAGEWEIDFTRPQFTDNGIFAITGKTGSGKSSILDAISLALYGKTPRVDVTGNNNDVMTHGTTDCYSEIVFEAGGKKWKSSWKQERNRNGNLKQIERSVADTDNKIVADKATEVNKKIIDILGLSFEQFTKVILLAQGSFAAFLQADKNDKGELLEQITGTEIYGEISKKVFERNKIEKDKLDKVLIELGAIKILSQEEIEHLQNEIVDFESQNKLIENELQSIEKSKNRLSDLENLQKQIVESKQKLPELEQKVEKLTAESKENEKYENLVGEFVAIENKNTLVAGLLKDSDFQNRELEKARTDLKVKNAVLSESKVLFSKKENLLNEKTQELETKRKELTTILAGKQLSDYQKIKEEIIQFGTNIKNLIDVEKLISESKREIVKYTEIVRSSEKSGKELAVQIDNNKKTEVDLKNRIELLDEYIKFARTILSLEEHRKSLTDNKPCPLCGSLEHPFARGNEPKIGEKELDLKKLKEQEHKITNAILQDEKTMTKLLSDKNNAQSNSEKENKKLSENSRKRNDILTEIGKEKPDFSISEEADNSDFLITLHKEQQNEYRRISETTANAENCEKRIKTIQDNEIPQLQNEKQAAEKAKTNAETALKLAELQTKNQENLVKTAKEKHETAHEELMKIFAGYEVKTLEGLKKCLNIWNENKKKKEDLNTQIVALKAVIIDKEKELTTKQTGKITEKSLDELQTEYHEKKKLANDFLQKIGINRQALLFNEKNLTENAKKIKEKERQQEICSKWNNLNKLIGSQDGKTYRNFAQALTFEHLIGLANRQLEKISERYILKRIGDASNPFELSVIDKFQNYDERTAQNLSGGEKFIVSLSLALGLSNIASRNMRIDTLFIDEGFGTLDSDYLDVALTALSNLQNEGKLIGVISHLSELKERIVTHIDIISKGNGHSEIKTGD